MKRLLIILLSISLLTACNNGGLTKKDKTEKDDRDRDRDRDDDKYGDDDDDYKKNKDDDDDDDDYKKDKYKDDDDDDDDERGGGGGWSSSDEKAFLNTCITNATNAGADQRTSKTHCNCVLEKIERKYRSLNDANQNATKPELDEMEQECIQERNN